MSIEILLVEDSPGHARLTTKAFRNTNRAVHLNVVVDGTEALAFLRRQGDYSNAPRPDLILLDLNVPKTNGRKVLEKIKENDSLTLIPTVVLTTSDDEVDILRSYQLQANGYLVKPIQPYDFEILVESINDFWLLNVKLRDQAKTR
jgi:chemotaxis family two-component system response regulator Rcp1